MPIADVVDVVVSLSAPGITRAGFGVPLIVSHTANWPERTRTYTTAAAVAADFPAAGAPEALAAAAIFAQTPRPKSLIVGRAVGVPTEVQVVSVAAVAQQTKYQVRVFDQGVSQTAVWGDPANADQVVADITAAHALLKAAQVRGKTLLVTSLAAQAGGGMFVWDDASTAAEALGPPVTVIRTSDYATSGVFVLAATNDLIASGIAAKINALGATLPAAPSVLSGTGLTAAGQVLTTTDNQTMTLNQYAGYWLVSATYGAFLVVSHTAVSGAPGVFTVSSPNGPPVTDAGAYKLLAPLDCSAAATGSGGSKVVTITGTAGKFFAIEPLGNSIPGALSDTMTVQETTANPATTIQTDLAALKSASSDWYAFCLPYKSSAIVTAAAAWAEADGTKLFMAWMSDTLIAGQALGVGTDTQQTIKSSTRTRTVGVFHPRADEFGDAAELGRFLPINPGADNWRMKALSGVTPVVYTATQITNLKAKFAGFYYDIVTGTHVVGGDGKSAGNEYVDVVRGIDWYVANLAANIIDLELQNEKIPFTDAGISLIKAQIHAMNDAGIAAGLINPGSPPGILAPVVIAPKAGDVSSADRQARNLTGVSTAWTLAGAVNTATVNVIVTQ